MVEHPLDAHAGDPDFMMSLARGLHVLRVFSEAGPGLTLSEVAAKAGFPRASARRCLHTLEKLGYVGTDGKTFSPKPGLLALADAYLSPKSFPMAAQDVLEALRDRIGESCSLGMLDGDQIVYVARAERTRIMALALHVGSRLPAWCTSMGRVMLAALADAALDEFLDRARLERRTDFTVTDPDALRAAIATVRTTGYAFVEQELEIGLHSVAVPVRDPAGRVIAALNVGTSVLRFSAEEMRSRVVDQLRIGARELSRLAR